MVGMNSNRERPLKPVLIIPGFMSSGLVIQKSSIDSSWEGKRLWLNLSSLGFNSLHVGGALRKNEEEIIRTATTIETANENVKANTNTKRPGGLDNDGSRFKSSRDMHQEYLKQVQCKSRWVEHVRLQSDMIHERMGVEVRPIPGTAGVDYLAPGALTESMSYVFGPVLKLLKSVGYLDGINLDAAPYDWRIPPSELQNRDKYFTNTMKIVEHLYKQSNNTPVVILCHSMGCKTAHYLFNFVLNHLGTDAGQHWLNRHVDSYVPVGAPHTGAPKSIRAIMNGDKMGLDAFLEDAEGLMLGRSLGSGLWLFPLETKQDKNNMLHAAMPQSAMANVEIESLDLPQLPSCPAITLRHESSLHISIPSQRLFLEKFLHHRETLPSKVRLAICIGKKIKVKTDFCSVSTGKIGRSSAMVNFGNETIILACPPTIEEALKLHTYIQIQIEEPGAGAPSKRHKGIFDCDVLWPLRCLFCLFRWVCCLPCSIVRKSLCVMTKGAKKGASAGAAALGSTRVIGESEKVEWKRNIMKNSRENDDVEKLGGKWHDLQIGLEPIEKYRYGFFLQAPSPEKMLIKCRWKPPPVPPDSKTTSTVCHQSAKDISYQTSYAQQLLSIEGLSNAIQLMNETYGKDPIGPHSLSAFFPPPIKKVIAIYGINLPTEVGAIYQRNPSVHLSLSNAEKCPQSLFVLDKDASLDEIGSKTHAVEKGLIRETKKTPQTIIGTDAIQKKSGDGTVPYWSLQQCRMWQGKGVAECDVKVHEIESAEHRAILNDSRFHDILLEILGIVN